MRTDLVTPEQCAEFLQSFSETVSEYIKALLNCDYDLCEETALAITHMSPPMSEGDAYVAFSNVKSHFGQSLGFYDKHDANDVNNMIGLVKNLESSLEEFAKMHCCAKQLPQVQSAEYAEILRKNYPSLDISL